MAETTDFGTIFGKLKAILQLYEPKLNLAKSDTYDYQLSSKYPDEQGEEVYFGGVKGEDMAVDFCLQAASDDPGFLRGISSQLKEHLRGEGCFHFEVLDDDLHQELLSLTEAAFSRYIGEDLVQ